MRDAVIQFIEKVGNQREFKLFLNIIRNIPKNRFAVIKISGATLENHLDSIAHDIAYLNTLGIYPILVHGAGTELDKRLPDSVKKDGIRITKREDMEIISDVFKSIGNRLAEKINQYGGAAKCTKPLFQCERIPEYGYVGNIKSVDVSKIEEIIEMDHTPVISPIGISDDGYLNINADTAAKEVILGMNPNKVILLTETGGILDENGEVIPFINPFSEDDLSYITGGMLLKLKEITSLLESNVDLTVSVTSAQNILKEIFTLKGSGTFIKSYDICASSDIGSLETEKIRDVLEGAFNKKLADDFFRDSIKEILYERNYEGVAIIKEILGIPYLDKFAVAKHRQETGLGSCIWNSLVKKYPKLVWRVTPKNPLNAFYAKKCTGCMKFAHWNVYWINLSEEEVFPIVKKVISVRKTII